MFARFVCALLSFCARDFPAKSETQETRKIVVECTSYTIYYIYNITYTLHIICTEIRRRPRLYILERADCIVICWTRGEISGQKILDA